MSGVELAPVRLLSSQAIVTRYVLFAVIAGLSNIAAQELAIRSLPGENIIMSLLAGTAIGFFVRYLLCKQWVFFDDYQGHVAEVRKIFVYGMFSVVTTVLFWIVELGSWYAFQTSEAKYVGAMLGLGLGNWIKYLFDKHYVFGARRG